MRIINTCEGFKSTPRNHLKPPVLGLSEHGPNWCIPHKIPSSLGKVAPTLPTFSRIHLHPKQVAVQLLLGKRGVLPEEVAEVLDSFLDQPLQILDPCLD